MQTSGPTIEYSPYVVTVMGGTTIQLGGRQQTSEPLTDGRRLLLTHLVVAGARGISAGDIETETREPMENSALRMAIARLRRLLPPGSLPNAVEGRYRLALPRTQVDLWHLTDLAAGGHLDGISSTQLRHLLTPRVPAIDSPTERGDEVPDLQLALIARLARDAPAALDVDLLDKLRAQVAEHPFNEQLLAIAATCIARSGDRRAAVNMVSAGVKALADIGLEPTSELRRVEAELLDGDSTVVWRGVAGLRGPAELPPGLRRQLVSPLVGRDDLVARLARDVDEGGVSTIVLIGPDGSGRSSIAAELARRVIGRGRRVAYAGASSLGEAAFGVFLSVLPHCRGDVEELLARPDDAETRRALVWGALTSGLDEQLGAHGLLVIDDCQWIDSQGAEYVAHLARGERPWRLLLVGSDRPAGPGSWAALRVRLARLGVVSHDVAPLTREQMQVLVVGRLPGVPSRRSWALAEDLCRLTSGRPGPAIVLLSSQVGGGAEGDGRGGGEGDGRGGGGGGGDASIAADQLGAHLDHLVVALAPHARVVGAALAAGGRAMSAPLLAGLTDLALDEVYRALDELVRSGLGVERSLTDFDLRDLETRSAALRGVLEVRVKEYHRRLADGPDVDVHARAHHLAAALPLVDAVEAARNLRMSGAAHSRADNHLEACHAYARAEMLDAAELTADDAWCRSRSLDLLGDRELARSVRSTAVALLVARGEHGAALRVVTSGLPEAEPLDGDPQVVELLESFDPTLLDAGDRRQQLVHLTRHHALAGQIDRAVELCDHLQRDAVTPAAAFDAAVLGRWVVAWKSPPEERIRLLECTDALDLDLARRAERHVLRAVDHYEDAALGLVTDELDALEALPSLPPVRRWHLMMFRAMLAAEAGNLTMASELRRRAHRTGLSYGFAEADAALMGAEFALGRLVGAHGGSAAGSPSTGEGPATTGPAGTGRAGTTLAGEASAVTTSVLAEAALALMTFDLGEHGAAVEAAERLVRRVTARPMSGGQAAVALVGPLLRRSSDRAAVEAARRALGCRGRSFLLVGAGAVSLGPVSRSLAALADTPDEALGHLEVAVDLADRSGARLWRAVCRRELLRHHEDDRVRRELREIVAGTELELVFPDGVD